MIVDDTPYNLYILNELIFSINPSIEVVQALHGREAIDLVIKARDSGKKYFDIVFMDLNMPVLDGFEVGIIFIQYFLGDSNTKRNERRRFVTHDNNRTICNQQITVLL